ncbi:helix-turn-helix domain-containing protein [Catenibacterium mitsuokai]
MANKAIRYRLYPNADQKIMFAKTFSCCRKVTCQAAVVEAGSLDF